MKWDGYYTPLSSEHRWMPIDDNRTVALYKDNSNQVNRKLVKIIKIPKIFVEHLLASQGLQNVGDKKQWRTSLEVEQV